MKKLEQLYEGKAKKVYATEDKNLVIVDYKDDATAFNGLKKGTIENKGVVNNKVSNFLMQMLEKKGIPTHFVEQISDRETIEKGGDRQAGGHCAQHRGGVALKTARHPGGDEARLHRAGVQL